MRGKNRGCLKWSLTKIEGWMWRGWGGGGWGGGAKTHFTQIKSLMITAGLEKVRLHTHIHTLTDKKKKIGDKTQDLFSTKQQNVLDCGLLSIRFTTGNICPTAIVFRKINTVEYCFSTPPLFTLPSSSSPSLRLPLSQLTEAFFISGHCDTNSAYCYPPEKLI